MEMGFAACPCKIVGDLFPVMTSKVSNIRAHAVVGRQFIRGAAS